MQTYTIRLKRRFDFHTHKEFFSDCNTALSSGCKAIYLDFFETDYMDSAALGMLLLLKDKADAKRIKISLHNTRKVLDILNIVHLEKVFDIS
jgi:anti-anti-sigma factor